METVNVEIEKLGLMVQKRICEAVQRGIAEGMAGLTSAGVVQVLPVAAKPRKAAGRPKSKKGACSVPGCGKAQAAKGLCPGHYRKAHKLGYGGESGYTPAQLSELATDGRTTRWSKATPEAPAANTAAA